jgi:hypothetical protein
VCFATGAVRRGDGIERDQARTRGCGAERESEFVGAAGESVPGNRGELYARFVARMLRWDTDRRQRLIPFHLL